jgi:hypothetical protein
MRPTLGFVCQVFVGVILPCVKTGHWLCNRCRWKAPGPVEASLSDMLAAPPSGSQTRSTYGKQEYERAHHEIYKSCFFCFVSQIHDIVKEILPGENS